MAEHTERYTDRQDVVPHTHTKKYAGLYTPGILGKWPWIGLIMFLIGGITFGAIAFNVSTNGPLLQLDKPLSVSLPAYSLQHQALFHPLTDAGFFIGGWLLTIGALLLLMYFASWHVWEEFFLMLFGMVGESVLFEVIDTFVKRPRPPTQIWHVLTIPGFPSGHSEASLVFYGLMAYLLVPRVRSSFGKALIIIFSILIIAFVGFTRVFTAGHYLTDVIAGYGLGLAWAGLAYTFVELYFKERRNRNGKKGRTYSP